MPPRPASLADGLGSIAGLAPNPPGDNPRRSRRSSHLSSKKVNLVVKNGTHTPDVHTVDTVGASKEARPKPSAKGENRSKDQANDASKNAEVSSVPDPVPAGDAAPVHTSLLFMPKATGSAALSGSNTMPAPVTATLQFFTPLPAYYSMAASTSRRDASISLASLRSASAAAASSYSPTATKPAVNVQQSKPQQSISHRMSTTVIVLLALGGICVLGAILVVVKLRRRPKRRWPPTPSLPILQDQDYPKEKAAGGGAKGKGDESPIFGGKERFSSRPGSNAVLWNWTQYQSGIPKPPPAAKGGDARVSVIDNQRRYSRIDDATTAKIQQATSATYVQPQIVQNTAPRTPSRLSTVSLYPGTNYPQSNEHIGIAVSELPNTKAGVADSSATTGKSGAQDFGRRRSVRRSMRDLRDLDRRRTTLYDGTDSLAYVEADVSSPSILPVAQGRERIKAPYGAGSYLRTSTSASAIKHASVATDSNPFEEPAYAVPSMPYTHSNEERRDRNPKALTSALSLASPAPPSPEPTLYPDDSLSVVGDRRHVASQKKHLAQTKVGSPGTEATALGNMMLSDYRTSKHGGPVTDGRAHGGTPDDVLGALDSPDDFAPLRLHRRADDKPPRVPSPPPLPSLAQMAMAHTNADDFADYRSPTYSIYGLYDPDRKSRATEGGY